MLRKVLTFDCYGTLLDTGALNHSISRVATDLGIAPEEAGEVFRSYEDRLMYGEAFRPYEALLREILEYCDMAFGTVGFEAAFAAVLQAHRAFTPFPDVLETLRALKAEGYELYLMSNTSQELMNGHRATLEEVFDDALVADAVGCYKPDLRFFEAAAQRFHLESAWHCHIAKGYWWDIVPCATLGWKKVWVNRSGIRGRAKEQPYREIPSLKELMQPGAEGGLEHHQRNRLHVGTSTDMTAD